MKTTGVSDTSISFPAGNRTVILQGLAFFFFFMVWAEGLFGLLSVVINLLISVSVEILMYFGVGWLGLCSPRSAVWSLGGYLCVAPNLGGHPSFFTEPCFRVIGLLRSSWWVRGGENNEIRQSTKGISSVCQDRSAPFLKTNHGFYYYPQKASL